MSGSTVARLKEKWQGELAIWQGRRLDEVEAVYLWIDGIDVKAGLEKEKAALLVVWAALRDGRNVLVAVTPGYRESTESWGTVLRDLRTDAAKRVNLVKNATAVIGKMLLVAEQTFRRVKHPALMPVVYRGVTFMDGMQVEKEVTA